MSEISLGKTSELGLEPSLYLPANRSGRFWVGKRVGDVWSQSSHSQEELPKVLEEASQAEDASTTDIYISQATTIGVKRRLANFSASNTIWVDFDYYKTEYFSLTPEQFSKLVTAKLADLGIPAPSYTQYSGRGLYAKWILDESLPRPAMSRFRAVLKELAKKLSPLGADIHATLPIQTLRIVGSVNMRQPQWYSVKERTSRIIDVNFDSNAIVKNYSIDHLSESILPYSREEVALFREKQKSFKWQNFASNQAALEEYLKSIRKGPLSDINPEARVSIYKDEAANLWWKRLLAMRSIAVERGGIADGQGRNDWCWIAANAMAWSCPRDTLSDEMEVILSDMIPSYGSREIINSASAIANRVQAGQSLYAMSTSTLCDKLQIDKAEFVRHLPNERPEINRGAMGLDPIRGLSFKAYKAERLRRQSLAAQRTNEIQRSKLSAEREQAKAMALEGKTTREIGLALGVSHTTVARWIKS